MKFRIDHEIHAIELEIILFSLWIHKNEGRLNELPSNLFHFGKKRIKEGVFFMGVVLV